MADPLSVAASIAGLIALAGKLTTTVYSFQQSVGGAPESAQHVKEEVDRIRMVLSQVEQFLHTTNRQTGQSSAHMIYVQDFLRVVSDCALTFSSLDGLVDELVTGGQGILPRMKWAMKDKEIVKLAERLGRLGNTLGIMINLATCHTVQESREDFKQLRVVMDDLRTDMMLSGIIDQRLETAYGYHTGTFHSLENDDARVVKVPTLVDDRASLRSRRSFILPQYHTILRSTKVYLRARRNLSVDSFCSEDRTASASTILSSVSLGDVSDLSFFALPLYRDELPGLAARPSTYQKPQSSVPIEALLIHCHSSISQGNINSTQRRLKRLSAVCSSADLETRKIEFAFAALKTRKTSFIRELLLETKLDVNSISSSSSTLLYSAIEFEDSPTVQMLLLDFSADPRIIVPRKPEKTALHLAIQRGDMVSLRLILNHDPGVIPSFNGNDMNLLLFAVQQGQGKPARFLVGRGYSPTETFNGGRTLLHYAAGRDRSRAVRGMIRWLVEDCGLDVNTPGYAESPLTIALKEEYDGQNDDFQVDGFGQVLKVDRMVRWNHPAIAELLLLGATASEAEKVELRKWAFALKLGTYKEGFLVGDVDLLVESRPDIFDESRGEE